MDDTEGLLSISSNYFKHLFTTSNAVNDERVLGRIEKRVTDSMNMELLKPFMSEEI